MDSIYIIGDIHGSYKTFLALLNKLPSDAKICLTGDLIDRGPDSKKVLQYVIDNNIMSVMGNHDLAFAQYPLISSGPQKDRPKIFVDTYDSHWGIMDTFKNYLEPIFDKKTFLFHREYILNNFPLFYYFEFDNALPLVVSHSLILPYWKGPNGNYSYEAEFIQSSHIINHKTGKIKFKNFDFSNTKIFNIIGHTAFKEVYFQDNFAVIDTAATFGNKLTAYKYPEGDIIQQKYVD